MKHFDYRSALIYLTIYSSLDRKWYVTDGRVTFPHRFSVHVPPVFPKSATVNGILVQQINSTSLYINL